MRDEKLQHLPRKKRGKGKNRGGRVAFIFEVELRNKERKSPGDSLLNVAFFKKEKSREPIFSKVANPLVEEKF